MDRNENLTTDLEVTRKRIHNAQSVTCYRKHKTMEEIENKAEAKWVCLTQDKLFRKIISLITTARDHNNELMLPSPTAAVSDSESNNNNANPIYKIYKFIKDVTYPHYPKVLVAHSLSPDW